MSDELHFLILAITNQTNKHVAITNAYKIAETYIKFDLEYTKENQELIRRAYLEYVNKEYRQFFEKIEISAVTIEFEKGSLKTRIIAWATAINLFVSNYGSFRSGLKDLIGDIQTASEWTINYLKQDPNLDDENIIRSERRLGVPGKLNDLYKKVDSIQRNANNLSPNEIQHSLSEVKQEIADISVLLEDATRQQFIDSFPDNIKQHLPEPREDDQNVLVNKYGLKAKEGIELIP